MKTNSTFDKVSAHIFHQLRTSFLSQVLDLSKGPQITPTRTQFFNKPESTLWKAIHWNLHSNQRIS
jgi:hypothetical protein